MAPVTRLGAVRAFGIALAVALLIAGCGQSPGSRAAPSQEVQSAPTAAELADLRSTPASEPMSGPRVPGIFSLEDARSLTGLPGIRIVAQTG